VNKAGAGKKIETGDRNELNVKTFSVLNNGKKGSFFLKFNFNGDDEMKIAELWRSG
jgi:hypothetical protein